MLFKQLHLQNVLSFGPDTPPLELRPLNVLIGANGTGKSNLIEAISLLRAAPRSLAEAARTGGDAGEWIWKGPNGGVASIRAAFSGKESLRYTLAFSGSEGRFVLEDERLDGGWIKEKRARRAYYRYERGSPDLWDGTKVKPIRIQNFQQNESILSQVKHPDRYPELTRVARELSRIEVYRDWSFGRLAPSRRAQRADLRNDKVEFDGSNLALVINRLCRDPAGKHRLLSELRNVLADVREIDVSVESGWVQLRLTEHSWSTPSTRLSDGTLRYFWLLAILLDPDPPPLICLEEPELGLHPDAVVAVVDLLKEASKRTQLIVTTHSDLIVDALQDSPADIVVFDKVEGATTMRRLDSGELKAWLAKYTLGELWRSGQIGGNLW